MFSVLEHMHSSLIIFVLTKANMRHCLIAPGYMNYTIWNACIVNAIKVYILPYNIVIHGKACKCIMRSHNAKYDTWVLHDIKLRIIIYISDCQKCLTLMSRCIKLLYHGSLRSWVTWDKNCHIYDKLFFVKTDMFEECKATF